MLLTWWAGTLTAAAQIGNACTQNRLVCKRLNEEN